MLWASVNTQQWFDFQAKKNVLFEALAGHPPFEDASRRAVLVHQMVDKAPDLRSQRHDVPPEVAIYHCEEQDHEIEQVGQALRAMMPFLDPKAP